MLRSAKGASRGDSKPAPPDLHSHNNADWDRTSEGDSTLVGSRRTAYASRRRRHSTAEKRGLSRSRHPKADLEGHCLHRRRAGRYLRRTRR
eukprot:2531319-Prymnesium_polylepis.1